LADPMSVMACFSSALDLVLNPSSIAVSKRAQANPLPLFHLLGPSDMPLETKGFRHVPVTIPELSVARRVAVSPRQQSVQSQQQDVAQG
jgi:hypothetical protein